MKVLLCCFEFIKFLHKTEENNSDLAMCSTIVQVTLYEDVWLLYE